MKKLSCSDSDVPSGEETPSRAGLSYVPKARSDPLERDPFRLGGGSRPAVRECGVLCVSGGDSIALGGERVLRSELLETASKAVMRATRPPGRASILSLWLLLAPS